MNPYIEFVKQNYKKVKAQNPNLKQTQIMKKIAEMYRAKKQKGGFRTAQYIEPFVPM
jgi:hypothetical protein